MPHPTDTLRSPSDLDLAWLEEESAEALEWQGLQRKRSRAHLDAVVPPALAETLAPACMEALTFAPQHAGEHWFFRRLGAEGLFLAVATSPHGDDERALVDVAALSAQRGGIPLSLDYFYPSPDGAYVAFGLSEHGDEQSILHVADVETGELLPERIPYTSNCYLAWLPDSSGFYYNAGTTTDFTSVEKFLFFHRLGDEQVPGPEPITLPDSLQRESYSIKPKVSPDGRYVAAMISEVFPRPAFVKDLSPDGEWRPFLADVVAQTHGVFVDDSFVAITTLDAPRGRLVSIPVHGGDDPSTWRSVRPEGQTVLRSLERVGDQLLLCEYDDAHCRLHVLGLDGKHDHEIALPARGVALALGVLSNYQLVGVGADNVLPGNGDVTFVFSTLTTSPAAYRYDLDAKRLEQLTAPALTHPDLSVEDRWTTAPDGVRVRYRVVSRKDMAADVTAPALLYGYGGFNVSFIPGYLGPMLQFAEAGGRVVFMHLRGGNEFGTTQWFDGRFERKQHTFDDAFAVAEDVVASGLAGSDQLGVVGASGGGLLTGVLITQRPELWRACVSMIGFYDLLGFTRDPYTALCALDLGDPAVPEEAEYLRAISPVHNAAPAAYPATLVTAAAHDMRCWPWHARKLAAALQATNTGINPILLAVDDDAGHLNALISPEQVAQWMGFLLHELGLT